MALPTDLDRPELAAMRVQWAGLPDARVERVGGCEVLAAVGPPWLTQVRPVDEPVDLDSALAQAPGALVQLVDGDPLECELEQRRYRRATRLLRLAAPAASAQASALRVERVGPEAAALVADLCRQGFGLDLPQWWAAPLGRPGWTQVVAYDGDVPVATGGLHVGGDVGWVSATSTVPAARGRGAHAALLALRLRLAAEQGAQQVGVKVEPGSASHRNLLRAGFAPADEVTQWERR